MTETVIRHEDNREPVTFTRDMLDWLPKFATGTRIEVGQMLARLK